MAKLHENLAVEKTLEQTANKLLKESIHTLGKDNLFLGSVKKFTMFDEELKHLNGQDIVNLETTVDENIDYVVPHIARWYDAVLQKDLTNQNARADIVLANGDVLAKDLPATFLLGMETKLTNLREMYIRIPTLAPGIGWQKDESNEKANVFMTPNAVQTFKTEKQLSFEVVVQPTEFHPAQTKEVQKVVNIGANEITRTCGMLAPVEKAARIARLDELLVAVRKARSRANGETLVKAHVGMDILKYING